MDFQIVKTENTFFKAEKGENKTRKTIKRAFGLVISQPKWEHTLTELLGINLIISRTLFFPILFFIILSFVYGTSTQKRSIGIESRRIRKATCKRQFVFECQTYNFVFYSISFIQQIFTIYHRISNKRESIRAKSFFILFHVIRTSLL